MYKQYDNMSFSIGIKQLWSLKVTMMDEDVELFLQ